METVDPRTGMPSPAKSFDFVVTDDLAGLPVTNAELDAIEAFLGQALRDLFAPDSEPPQMHGELEEIPKRRGARQ
ncbi:hypothetical protein [Shinella pollutisoli]|uniref:Uncharacterized protein n=1 Tax=Shinella pollutisoli TaxID=2250594 RepID=A0ABV7DB87_9HYPH|nr:hypothetical protein [Shinella pollutisoli]